METQAARKLLFQSFDPMEALPEGDPRYVDIGAARGTSHFLTPITETIQLAATPTVQFVAGHRGCGKTTELQRLGSLLNARGERFLIVDCEADDYLDLSETVEYSDLLLAVLQALNARMVETGESLALGRVPSFFAGLRDILTADVEPDAAEVDLDLVKIGFKLKKNPDVRHQVRDALRPRGPSFLEAVQEVVQLASQKLTQRFNGGIVILFDNLDRLIRHQVPHTTRDSYEELFIHSADQLRSLPCHVVYTVPPSLTYSRHGLYINEVYGTPIRSLPMLRIRNRDGTPREAELSVAADLIGKRVSHARGIAIEAAFDSVDLVERICRASGGYPRELVGIARQAIVYAEELPISEDAVSEAINSARDIHVQALRGTTIRSALKSVAATKALEESEVYLQLLDTCSVLEYLDEAGYWYDVNPLLQSLL